MEMTTGILADRGFLVIPQAALLKLGQLYKFSRQLFLKTGQLFLKLGRLFLANQHNGKLCVFVMPLLFTQQQDCFLATL